MNANGGINGRRIEYLVEDDQWNPEVAAQAATKLLDDEQVVLMVASASFVEATVNAPTYEDRGILVVPSACATSECFEAKNMSSTNAGPAPANVSAAQWAVENLGSRHVACIGLNIPSNGGWSCDLVAEGLELVGAQRTSVLLDPAGVDFTSVVLTALATGADTFLLNLPAGVGIGVLKAAEEQDLASMVTFISPTPLFDESVPEAIGPYWDGRLWLDIELLPLDSTGPDNTRWRTVMEKYGADHPIDTFSQAGFLAANIVVDTLMEMDPDDITRETVSERIRSIKAYETDMTCTPWYFGPGERLTMLERRMTEIAKALAGGPRIVMLDEPGAGLSGQEAKRLREAIQEVPGRFDAMVVLIDHYVELIRAVCQETIVLDFGQKIAEGATASVLSNETVRAAHLGEDFLA